MTVSLPRARRLADREATGRLGVPHHQSELTDGQTVHVRHAEPPNIAHAIGIQHGAINLEATQRVGSIQDDHFLARLETRFHRNFHRAAERVAAGANVLQIDYERIDTLQLRGSGSHEVALVEGKHHEPRAQIDFVWERFLRRQIAVEPVLDGIERDQLHAGRAAQDIDRAEAPAVHAGRMREEADAFAPDCSKALGFEHIDAEHDGRKIFIPGWHDHGCVGHGRRRDRLRRGRLRGRTAGEQEPGCKQRDEGAP